MVPGPGCHGSRMQLQVSLGERSPSETCHLNGSLAVPYRDGEHEGAFVLPEK